MSSRNHPCREVAHDAWKAAAKVNAQRSLVTRDRRVMLATGLFCNDDETVHQYVVSYLWKLPAVASLTNTVVLGLFMANDAPDLMSYSLGGGRT